MSTHPKYSQASIRIADKGNNSSSKDRLCSSIGLTESSNMLLYSNASSIEKNRRYLLIKRTGCLPGCSGKGGSSSPYSIGAPAASVSGCTGEEEGEEIVNMEQTNHHTKYNKAIRGARGDLTQG